MDNVLQHSRILLPKECTNIPDKWLELEIFDLLKYPSKLDRFELYDFNNERVCMCRFVKGFEKDSKLSGYFSKPYFRNYYSKIFGNITTSKDFMKQCKKSSSESKMDNSIISGSLVDITTTENGGLTLIHSAAARVLTNDSFEDSIEGIENSTGSGGGKLA